MGRKQKGIVESDSEIRKVFQFRKGTFVNLNDLTNDYNSYLVVLPSGRYEYQCPCGTLTSGSLRSLDPRKPSIMCGDLRHGGREGFIAVGLMEEYLSNPDSVLVYTINRMEQSD